MPRNPSHLWDPDLRSRLDAAATRHPDARAWLTLLSVSLQELDRVAWGAVPLQLHPDRPVEAPLLAGATLALAASMVRDWVQRLLRQAVKMAGPSPGLLAAVDSRRFDPVPSFEAAVCLDEDRLAHLAKPAGADPRALGA